MKKISHYLLAIIMVLIAVNTFAKPGFVVTPFAKNVNLAANSSLNVLVVTQNMTTVNQTVTNIVPTIPASSGISGTVLSSDCGLLNPGDSCAALIKLQSGNQPSTGNLNISICSFNGAFCSRIVKPLDFNNSRPIGIFITPSNSSIANGTTQQFYAIGLFSNSTFQNVTNSVTWSSSANTKATINSEGLATGVAPGNSTISATLDGASDATTLTVTPATLTSISVTPTNTSISNGTTQQFTATGIFSDNSNQDLTSQVTWSSSNTAVATISNISSQKGLASSKSVGQSTITATFGTVSGSSSLNVTTATLSSISVTPTNPFSDIFTTQQFTATAIYSDNSVKDVTNVVRWSSQSALIAIVSNQVSSKGLALGIGVGSTNIIATLGNVTGSTTLQVTAAVLTGIDVSPININLPTGSQQLYTATGTYSNGRNQDITTQVLWQSSTPSIASISNAPGYEGLANGIRAGSVIISATLDGVVGTTNLTVNSPTLQSITVTPITPTIANGTEQQFTATGTYSDSSTRDLTTAATWVSSTPSVAVISNVSGSKGLASSIAGGSTTITAIFNNVSGNTTLTVSAATLTSITVTPANASMPIGTDQPFTATGNYSDATTKNITREVTWISSKNSKATISNATVTKGLATGVDSGSTTISAIKNGISGSTALTVFQANIGDSLEGGKIACLDGGLNNLITANVNNADTIAWGGSGTTTNAQSSIDGGTNTTKIVTVLGAGTNYAAGVCAAYEIDSAGNTPCIGGNTCYNDWFLPAIKQLNCMRDNRNQISGFTKDNYWSSTEDSIQSSTSAFYITFQNSGHPSATASKTELYAIRCTRLINAAP